MAERFIDRRMYWELKWIAAARPPVHPDLMEGRAYFDTQEKALTFFERRAEDATLVSLTLIIEERKDFTEDFKNHLKGQKKETPHD